MTKVSPAEWYRLRFPEETKEIESLTIEELRERHVALLGELASSDAEQGDRLKRALSENPNIMVFLDEHDD